ncbi:hypothetical protein DFJ74DRAFT_664165 [Hyaloraphidium curvatum]|nr:hypothetical protein DFJ74DRAFT_664163 [Hyaloraphidium curvatum]KAI9026397.1 hypothetical protein DFJ74DRAFT_664165 [Hyaloraphidium curvatum]
MAAELRTASAPLALQFRLHRAAVPAARFLFGVMAAAFLCCAANWAAFWLLYLPGGFGRAQAVVATVSSLVLLFRVTMWNSLLAAYTSTISQEGRIAKRSDTGTGATAAAPGNLLDTHALAGLVRWLELLNEDRPKRTVFLDGEESAPAPHRRGPGVLLAHDGSDAFCPCPSAACAGPVARRASTLLGVETAFLRVATSHQPGGDSQKRRF